MLRPISDLRFVPQASVEMISPALRGWPTSASVQVGSLSHVYRTRRERCHNGSS